MFCRNCGTENEANAAFCKSCGAPMAAETEQNPVTPEDVSSVQAPVAEPVTVTASTPKKKKKVLAALIAVAAVIVVALAVLLIGFKDTIAVKMASAEKQQMYAFDQLASDFTDAYGEAMTTLDTTGVRGSFKVELGETAKSLISESGVDLSGVDSAELVYDASRVDNTIAINAALNYNGEELIGAEAVADIDAGVLTLSVPALSDEALKLDLAETFGDVNSLNISIEEFMPDTALVEKLIPRYIDAALGAIKDVERTKETFTVGEVSQKATCYTTEFSEKLFADMVLEVIKKAKEDADLKTVIFDFINEGNKLVAPEDAEDAQEIYDELITEIDEAIEEYAEETFSEEPIATLKVWVNGKFGIIGAQLDIVDEGTVFAGKAESGSDVAEAVYVLEDGEKLFELTSKGTLKRGIYNGELVVSAEGQTIVSLKSENVDTEAEDAFIGKITVTSPALSDANPALAMLSVSVEGTKEGNKQTLAIGVGMGDGALATVTVSTEQYAAEKGKLHENTTEDAEEWIMSLYTSEKFSEILENSGLSGILESLMYMDSDDYYDDEYYDDEYDYYDEEFTDEELGYDDGYLDGYYDGYDGEYKECYGECMNEDKADSEEYMDAYDLGYEEGYADGQSDLEADQSIPDDEAGYDDGYTDGYYDGYGGEYKAGYGDCIDEDRADSEEYMDAYDRGYEEGYAEGVAEMKAFEAETA